MDKAKGELADAIKKVNAGETFVTIDENSFRDATGTAAWYVLSTHKADLLKALEMTKVVAKINTIAWLIMTGEIKEEDLIS